MRSRVHQPFRITKHRNVEIGMIKLQTINLRKSNAQFRRTRSIKDDDIRLCRTESLRESILCRLQIRNTILDLPVFQLTTQSESEVSFLTRRVIAVDENGVIILEALKDTCLRKARRSAAQPRYRGAYGYGGA